MPGYYQRLLVPLNGRPSDERVLEVVGQLVHRHPVAITLIYVVEVMQSMPLDAELPAEIDRGEAVLRRAEHTARHGQGHRLENVDTELLQARSAGAAIVDEAIERAADAIVMGATVRHRHGKSSLGETAVYVLKNAPCEVVVVRHPSPGGQIGDQRWT